MSSMLDQAIIDAKLLQETAQKKAEASIIKKYEPEIKKAIQMLLEQDDALGGDSTAGDMPATEPEQTAAPLDMGGMDAMSGGEASPETKKFVKDIPAAYLGEDNSQEIEINLDSIVEKIDAMEKELNIMAPDLSTPAHEVVPQANPTRIAQDTLAESSEQVEETEELEEEVVEEDTLEEELTLDIGNVSAGGIHANEIELKRQHDIAKALAAQNAELQEQLRVRDEEFAALEEKLSTVFTSLKETKSKLNKSAQINVQLKEGFELLTKKIGEVNLTNARLLYTNKTLGNVSLNERQKKQIAESISKSKSVEEAKTIYETLQKSAQVVVEKRTAPQSLTEAINRAPSAFLPRKDADQALNPERDRWQRIAGIKK